MIRVRRSAERGGANFGWLDSKHTFSFGQYYDPAHMGFGPLRVINEDKVAPGGGFPTHAHANMEIVSYVLAGALEHKDSLGTGSTIRPGEVQRMSAGTGVQHSEFNASKTEAVHFLQIWIQPDRSNVKPRYDQVAFPPEARRGRWKLVISPDGADGSVAVHQDVRMYAALLSPGERVEQSIGVNRRAWLQVAKGDVVVNGEALAQGDGAAITSEAKVEVQASTDAEVLLFDLP